MILAIEEFIRRFLQHVLPKGFMKIRHYGFLSNKVKNKRIEEILIILSAQRRPKETFDIGKYIAEHLEEDINLCAKCKSAKKPLRLIIPKARSDPDHYLK